VDGTGCFNPHPPVGAGATQQLPRRARLRAVSILTRPWGRVQRYPQWSDAPSRLCFNPHPHLGAGATSRRVSLPASFSCFNPHPPLGAGATLKFVMAAPAVYRFQSSPARGGGCNPTQVSVYCSHSASFNPHPPLGAGATWNTTFATTGRAMFQSSPAPGGGCNQRRGAGSRPFVVCFNPHPPLGAGATQRGRAACGGTSVSILTRPWGRVQLYQGGAHADALLFQSSPAPGGGCNDLYRRGLIPRDGFNPHPPLRAGATVHAHDRHAVAHTVSILTRPWGRVQPWWITSRTLKRTRFQSSPARGGGCNTRSRPASVCSYSFQSSPARGGGCNRRIARALQTRHAVSILTRPWGRVQRSTRTHRSPSRARFNPHPPVGAGATADDLRRELWLVRFQSSPAHGGGCNRP